MCSTIRKNLFGVLRWKPRKSSRKLGLSPRRLAVEGLECRQMMSVGSGWFAQNLQDAALCSLAKTDYRARRRHHPQRHAGHVPSG